MNKTHVQLLAKIPDKVLFCMEKHERELFLLWQSMVELFPAMRTHRRQRFYLYVASYLVKAKLNDIFLGDPGGRRLYPSLCLPMNSTSKNVVKNSEKNEPEQTKDQESSAGDDEERLGWGTQFD